MKTTTIYNLYVTDNDDNILDVCGEFTTLADAREYMKYQITEDAKRLINYKYAIYINVEAFLE